MGKVTVIASVVGCIVFNIFLGLLRAFTVK